MRVEQRRLGVLRTRASSWRGAGLLGAEPGAPCRDQGVDAGEGGAGGVEVAAVEGVDRGVDLARLRSGLALRRGVEVGLGATRGRPRAPLLGREVALGLGDRDDEAGVDDRRLPMTMSRPARAWPMSGDGVPAGRPAA